MLARRKFFDVHKANSLPLARETLERIAAFNRVEDSIRGLPPSARLAVRIEHAAPLLTELRAWLKATRTRIPWRSKLAAAIRYALSR